MWFSFLVGGNWVSHCVNKCWLGPSGVFAVSAKTPKRSKLLGYNISWSPWRLIPSFQYRVDMVWRVCVCLLHMWICSTDVSGLPGSRISFPGPFGCACDMVTHSSIWSSEWLTQGKQIDAQSTDHFVFADMMGLILEFYPSFYQPAKYWKCI